MEKIAVISDIHGNIPALEAVLNDIKEREIEKIICLGDLAGKGPSSSEAVDTIRKNCYKVVKGNWDYFITEQEDAMLKWHQDRLGAERLKYMKELPIYEEFYMSGKLIRLCHASPNDIMFRTNTRTDKDKRMKLFEPTSESLKTADIVGYGDIHSAHVENFDSKTIFNTGSVGNPLDLTASSYVILEGAYGKKQNSSFSISIVRVPYDIEKSVQQAIDAEIPELDLYINELRTGIYRKIASK